MSRRARPLLVVLGLASLIAVKVAFGAACDPNDKKKTTICHVPPGNPQNPQTLCVDSSAISTHVGQHPGDHVGACTPPPTRTPKPTPSPLPSPTQISPSS